MIKNNLRRLKQYWLFLKHRDLLPDVVENSDLYLVEFPKSGIHWLSFIITNTCLLEAGINKRATHFNVEQFIGDIHRHKKIAQPPFFPYHRIIKSHSSYNPFYRHVVYLVRNPFSVMVSYYHFTIANKAFSGSIEEFVRDKRFGVKNWAEHIWSWIEPERPLKFHLIRYEDLHDDAFGTIKALYTNLGWCIDDEKIKKAIEMSSFEEMKKDDEHYRKHCPFRRYDFVREGKKKTELSDDIKRYILEVAGDLLERLFPEYEV